MAKAIEFEGCNKHVGEGCYNLPTQTTNVDFNGEQVPCITSAWQLSKEELKAVNASGGVVFLQCLYMQPPVNVEGINPTGL